MKIAILKAAKALLSVIYSAMKLFKQDEKRIVFISRQGDAPSRDFLLLEKQIHTDMSDFNTVMLCKKFVAKKSSVFKMIGYAFHVLKQTWHIARARVVLLDTYCIPVSLLKHRPNLLVIQLWHSIGCMKKTGYAILDKGEGSSSALAKAMRMHRGYDYVTLSSMSFVNDFLEGFDISIDKMVEIPLPKADLLTDAAYAKEKRSEITKKYALDNGKKNILYCPTFRQNSNSVSMAAKALYNALDKSKYNFIFQPHPIDMAEDIPKGIISTSYPTFEVIFASDYVISDYSSVIYEAGLAGKPILEYAYDWDDYSKERELNFDIKNEFPGVFTKDPVKIIRTIEKDDFDMDAQRSFIAKNVTMPKDKSCAQALTEFITAHLK